MSASLGTVNGPYEVNNVEELRRELEEKDLMIGRLRKQLERLEYQPMGVQSRAGPKKAGSADRLPPTDRSAPITSSIGKYATTFDAVVGAWLRRLGRRSSLGGLACESGRSLLSGRAGRDCSNADGRGESILPSSNAGDICFAELAQLKTYSYMDIMDGSIPVQNLSAGFLEWHLEEEDLLEYLSVCREFLNKLDPADLHDRKYRALLTLEQYHLHRSRL